jgi:tetratricopeptide (TPR) repeat protein
MSLSRFAAGWKRWLAVLVVLAVGGIGAGWWWFRIPTPAIPSVPTEGADPAFVELVEKALTDVRKQPRAAQTWGGLGKVLIANGQDELALRCFANAERFDPEDLYWPYYQGVRRVTTAPEQAAVHLRQAARLADRHHPEVHMPRLKLAEVLLSLDDLEGAEQALGLTPSRKRPLTRPLSPAYSQREYLRGVLACRRERWSEARDHLEPLVGSPEGRRKICAQLALVYQRLNQPGRSALYSQLMSASDPEDDWPDPLVQEYISLAVGTHNRLRIADALRDTDDKVVLGMLQEMLQESGGGQDDVHYALASQLARRGRYREAERALRRLLAQAPDLYRPHHALSNVVYIQGMHLRKAGGQEQQAQAYFEEAATLSRRAIVLNPQAAEPHFQLGRCLQALGRHKEAIEPLRQAVLRRPEHSLALVCLGESLAEMGEKEEALKYLKRGVQCADARDKGPAQSLARWRAKWEAAARKSKVKSQK